MSYLKLAKQAEERLKRERKPILITEVQLEEAGSVFHEQKSLQMEAVEVKDREVLQAVKIQSSILDDDLWLIIDPAFKPNDSLACYYLEEIPLLKNKTCEELQQIHRLKLASPGAKVVPKKPEGEWDYGHQLISATFVNELNELNELNEVNKNFHMYKYTKKTKCTPPVSLDVV